MTLQDSLYPLPPRENQDFRVVGSSELHLTVEYFDFVQYLIVTIEPDDGNCGLGCKLDAPLTTTVHLTGLSPGQTYTVYLSTESYDRRSDVIYITEDMNLGEIIAFRTISSSNMVTIEFQIEAGVGTEIILDYSAVKTGHTNSSTFPFRRFNRLVLTDLMPSDSYRMNLTLVGKGSPPKTKMKPFDVDLYPSVVEVTGTQELRTLLKINYRVAGNFSVMLITVKPDGSQCPCQIYDQSPTGQIVIGDVDTHPLTPGDEYFVTIRTSSFFGLQTSPTYIVRSLPVDVITWNTQLDGALAKFDVQVAGGVGSYIAYQIKDRGVNKKTIETGTLPFSHHVQMDVPSAVVGTCTQLILYFYSRGSKPHRSSTSNRAYHLGHKLSQLGPV
ncbi:uncharacterized protein LOC142350519 [Convolutriloba macropyga]|uniref:uncharacterized protein LOC142350519 n=1 Tax=Convolutriloba macropyga TaxID=536237 RepID=UPI003F51F002